MKKTIALISLLAMALAVHGQISAVKPFLYRNSFQLELAGPAVFYSLNLERILLNKTPFRTAVQAGISCYPPSTGIRDIWIPLGITEIYSMGNHHLEGGIGFMPVREAVRDADNQATEWFWSHLATGRIGYRHQRPDGRLIIRAAFTPVYELDGSELHPLGGLSIGTIF
ncbi:MAG: hypothetical protein V2B15_06010 [Bacteroidota bacterium]